MTITSTTVSRNPLEERSSHHGQQKSSKRSTWMQSQKQQNNLGSFPRQTIQYHSNSSLCPNHWCWEADQFYENLEDLLELKLKKYVLFIIGDWNAKLGSQDIHGVIGKFGLGKQNETGQRLTKFCLKNVLVIANTLFQQHKLTLHMDIT